MEKGKLSDNDKREREGGGASQGGGERGIQMQGL